MMDINNMTPTEKAEYEVWLDSIGEEKDVCPTCGGANFSEPPSYNYAAYRQVICPTCGGVDWILTSNQI